MTKSWTSKWIQESVWYWKKLKSDLCWKKLKWNIVKVIYWSNLYQNERNMVPNVADAIISKKRHTKYTESCEDIIRSKTNHESKANGGYCNNLTPSVQKGRLQLSAILEHPFCDAFNEHSCLCYQYDSLLLIHFFLTLSQGQFSPYFPPYK